MDEYFKSHDMIKLVYRKDLEAFIQKKFEKSCNKDVYFDQLHDYISQVEQEICMLARIFYHSEGSSWSLAISNERLARKKTVDDSSNTNFIK